LLRDVLSGVVWNDGNRNTHDSGCRALIDDCGGGDGDGSTPKSAAFFAGVEKARKKYTRRESQGRGWVRRATGAIKNIYFDIVLADICFVGEVSVYGEADVFLRPTILLFFGERMLKKWRGDMPRGCINSIAAPFFFSSRYYSRKIEDIKMNF
jgi:hypothetical protein